MNGGMKKTELKWNKIDDAENLLEDSIYHKASVFMSWFNSLWKYLSPYKILICKLAEWQQRHNLLIVNSNCIGREKEAA